MGHFLAAAAILARKLSRLASMNYLNKMSMDVYQHLLELEQYLEKENFKGYDPFDALNSPLLKALSLDKKTLRILYIQMLKRLPFNLRPMLGIKKGYNPKGIGLFLWGYAKLYEINKKSEYLEKIELLLDLLEETKSEGYSGNCWGYNFDWQSRAFYLPRYTPTLVNTSFIGHALIDTYEYTKNRGSIKKAVPIKDFILNDLNRTEDNSGFCFSYSPLDHTAIHNANLLGASLLIRLYKYTGDESVRDAALASLSYSMHHQRADGSWFYADTDIQSWIDSFHTGFNLQSILYFLKENLGDEFRDAFEKGVKFYVKNFFGDDGTPYYYYDRHYPIDIHSAAQAVVFFSQAGKSYQNLTETVMGWMIENLRDKNGIFYFRKGKFIRNKIPYIRWTQAWAFHALSEYLVHYQ
jgi:rhamnogalacturonyl hydrolase YesR